MHALDKAFKFYFHSNKICFLKASKHTSSQAAKLVIPPISHTGNHLYCYVLTGGCVVSVKQRNTCITSFMHFYISTSQEAHTAREQFWCISDFSYCLIKYDFDISSIPSSPCMLICHLNFELQIQQKKSLPNTCFIDATCFVSLADSTKFQFVTSAACEASTRALLWLANPKPEKASISLTKRKDTSQIHLRH